MVGAVLEVELDVGAGVFGGFVGVVGERLKSAGEVAGELVGAAAEGSVAVGGVDEPFRRRAGVAEFEHVVVAAAPRIHRPAGRDRRAADRPRAIRIQKLVRPDDIAAPGQ